MDLLLSLIVGNLDFCSKPPPAALSCRALNLAATLRNLSSISTERHPRQAPLGRAAI
jgi:hypothetical protein